MVICQYQDHLGQDEEVVGVVVVGGAVGQELLLRHHPVLVCVHVGEHLGYHHHHRLLNFRQRCHDDDPNHNCDTYGQYHLD